MNCTWLRTESASRGFPQGHEGGNDLTDAAQPGVTIGDPGVLDAAGMQSQEVGVVRDDDTLLDQRKRNVLLVLRAQQPDTLRRGNVNSAQPQAVGHCRVCAFVQMEPQPGYV